MQTHMNRSKAKVIYFSKNFKISQFINFNVEQTWIVTGKRISLSRIIISPALLCSKCIIIFENDLVDNYQPPYELDRLSRFTQDQQVSLLINGRARSPWRELDRGSVISGRIVKQEIYHRDKSREFIIVSVFKFFITILVAVKSHKAVLYRGLLSCFPWWTPRPVTEVAFHAAWEGCIFKMWFQPLRVANLNSLSRGLIAAPEDS